MATKISEQQKKRAAKEFATYWKGKGYEKGESQKFWLELLGQVFGVENPSHYIEFEDQVHLDHTSFIDGYIPETKVLIEQKSLGKKLKSAIRQSDGTSLTPFQQAKRYSAELPYSRRPRWIITCNFSEFLVYDMENPNAEPEQIFLENLPKEYYRLNFLTDTKNENIRREMEISIKAGELVGQIYDALRKQYVKPDSPESLRSLNILCVRLVFCLYAEDADVFDRMSFHDYLDSFKTNHLRTAIIDLFKTLDTPIEKRDPYLDDELAVFPYVNGGLFEEEQIEIPQFTEEIRQTLLQNASADFDWSEISPTIFGAVFESTLNPETRRKGGMHYTSIENIHKVIDPLFLNDLRDELEEIKLLKQRRVRENKLNEFCEKLSKLKFLDPACGSGNFLTETYLSLRSLENEALKMIHQDQIVMDMGDVIKVKISQFYGIEINDFAVTVAKTALWIAENQMLQKTADIVHTKLDFLPLTTNAYIVKGNALQLDWNEVVNKNELRYIMGNPPFVGQAMKTKEQAADMQSIFGKGASETKLDYVICWYKCAALYMQNTNIKAAFVSTNSICQGESVPTFWKNMYEMGIRIFFAHRSFKWSSEASKLAHVYCVIVGFSYYNQTAKYIFTSGVQRQAKNINAYLLDADDIWLQSRVNKPLNGLPKMTKGSEPTDGGNLFLSIDEKNSLLSKYPVLSKYIKPFIGGKEFTHNKMGEFTRYCLWFKNGNPKDYATISEIKARLTNIRQKRLESSAERIRRMADYPYLFCQERQPDSNYLLFPRHTTSDRKYIPFGFIDKDVIVGDSCTISKDASIYVFGLLSSNVHMAWTKTVCGRLGNEYRYSQLVYNNFPLPNPTLEQKARIEKTAQAILDARALYPDDSLASLYDELTMQPELRKAHQNNDRAVMEAYGFSTGMTESECVAELMKMYSELTKKESN